MLFVFQMNVYPLDNNYPIYSPFKTTKNRLDYSEIAKRTKDGFGAYRKAGHKHAGIDIIYDFSEQVYSIGTGTVNVIYGKFPYATVIISHSKDDGTIYYSAYTHIQDICVEVEQKVNEETVLGRVFNEEEFKKSEFYINHLHFEIRKTLERYKGISIKCFTMDELRKYFEDPLLYFNKEMKRGKT